MDHLLHDETEKYVTDLFGRYDEGVFFFHNLTHIKNVVARTEDIRGCYNIGEEKSIILSIAAWFHDTGYLFTEPEKHEEKSVEIMIKFLADKCDNRAAVEKIRQSIISTKFPTAPRSLLQEILCDADTYHLGTDDFQNSDNSVFAEMSLRNKSLTRSVFEESSLRLLEQHTFYTKYCLLLLAEGKRKNIRFLKTRYGL